MDNKRISIIIPTYNSSIILEENIKIISSYKQCKIFVIDDGSVSDEARKNKIICNNYGCNYTYTLNQGPSHARYVGLLDSDTEFCFFLDTDDYIAEFALDWGVNYLLENNEVDAIVFRSDYVEEFNCKNETGNIFTIKKYNRGLIQECIECLGYPKQFTLGWNQSNTLYRRNKIIDAYKIRYLTWGEDIPLKLKLISVMSLISVRTLGGSQIKISYGRGYKYTPKQIVELALEVYRTSLNNAFCLAFITVIRYMLSYFYKRLKQLSSKRK